MNEMDYNMMILFVGGQIWVLTRLEKTILQTVDAVVLPEWKLLSEPHLTELIQQGR